MIFVADMVAIGEPSLGVTASKRAVKCLEKKASRRNHLALGCVEVLVSPAVLAASTSSGSKDGTKQELDPNLIEAITGILNTSFVAPGLFLLLSEL